MSPADDPQAAESRYRILVVLPDASMGGGVRVVGELVREWVGMGLDVRTLSLSTSSATGREILRHAPHESLGGRSSMQRLFRLRRNLRRTEQRYDVVFAIGDYSAVLALLARMLMRPRRRPKVVNGVHQPRALVTSIATSRRSRPVRSIAIRGVQAVTRGVDGYVFLSEQQKYLYRKAGIQPKIPQAVIPNPVRFGMADRALLEERDGRLRRGDSIRLVTIGSLNTQKNHLLLLDVLALLDRRFLLTIVGGGEMEPALRDRISVLDPPNRAQLVGPREDIAHLLDNHDIFVLSSDYEASPLVILEAMVRGLPIVSTDCSPSSQELARTFPSVYIAEIGSVRGLATGVMNFSADPPSRAQLERAASTIVGQHSPVTCAIDHRRFFLSLR